MIDFKKEIEKIALRGVAVRERSNELVDYFETAEFKSLNKEYRRLLFAEASINEAHNSILILQHDSLMKKIEEEK